MLLQLWILLEVSEVPKVFRRSQSCINIHARTSTSLNCLDPGRHNGNWVRDQSTIHCIIPWPVGRPFSSIQTGGFALPQGHKDFRECECCYRSCYLRINPVLGPKPKQLEIMWLGQTGSRPVLSPNSFSTWHVFLGFITLMVFALLHTRHECSYHLLNKLANISIHCGWKLP